MTSTRFAVGGLALLVCLVCLVACDGGIKRASDDGGAENTLPLCSWLAAFNATDATTDQCRAGRAYLSCVGSNGGGELCLSDSLLACPGPNPTPDVSYSDCKNLCQPNEYALACGDTGPAPLA